jgi:hypothetical protein
MATIVERLHLLRRLVVRRMKGFVVVVASFALRLLEHWVVQMHYLADLSLLSVEVQARNSS